MPNRRFAAAASMIVVSLGMISCSSTRERDLPDTGQSEVQHSYVESNDSADRTLLLLESGGNLMSPNDRSLTCYGFNQSGRQFVALLHDIDLSLVDSELSGSIDESLGWEIDDNTAYDFYSRMCN